MIAAALAGAAIWVIQDFGEIFTGQGTDPNSGLLLIVIAAAFWPLAVIRENRLPGSELGEGALGPAAQGRARS